MNKGLECLHCGAVDASKVIDTTKVIKGIRRTHKCHRCEKNFQSTETTGVMKPSVKRRNGDLEVFNRKKVRNGIDKAFNKLDVDDVYKEKLTDIIHREVLATGKAEITSYEIGEITLTTILKDLNNANLVAYIRFATVFKYAATLDDIKYLIQDLERNIVARTIHAPGLITHEQWEEVGLKDEHTKVRYIG